MSSNSTNFLHRFLATRLRRRRRTAFGGEGHCRCHLTLLEVKTRLSLRRGLTGVESSGIALTRLGVESSDIAERGLGIESSDIAERGPREGKGSVSM